MTKREAENRAHMYRALESLGLNWDECETLRRCSMTLHRWAEQECNGEIETDEKTGATYRVSTFDGRRLYPTPNRALGALNRALRIVHEKPGLKLYHQGDPRGAALYVLRPSDIKPGEDVSAVYSRGIAVY